MMIVCMAIKSSPELRILCGFARLRLARSPTKYDLIATSFSHNIFFCLLPFTLSHTHSHTSHHLSSLTSHPAPHTHTCLFVENVMLVALRCCV